MLMTAKSKTDSYGDWWNAILDDDENAMFDDYRASAKMEILLDILMECQVRDECLLVFSQSTEVLTTVEHFLNSGKWGKWKKGEDYFRLDGSTPSKVRKIICKVFGSDKQREGKYPNARLLSV